MKKYLIEVLDKTSRWTQVDLRYFIKGGVWLSGGQIAMSGLAILSAVAFANLLPEEVFGNYRFVLSLLGILGLTTLTGMDTALVRAMSRGHERTLNKILRLKMLWSTLGCGAAVGISIYYFIQGNSLLASALALSALFIPFKDTLRIYDTMLQARKQFSRLATYRVLIQLISIASLTVTMFLTDRLLPVLLAYLLPTTVAEFFILRHEMSRAKLVGGTDQAAIRYGYHLSFLRGVGTAAGHINNIALFHFLGASSLAQFYFAVAPTEQLRAIIGQLDTLLFPKIARDEWKMLSFNNFVKKILPFILILSTIVLTYVLVAPLLYKIFFPQYVDAVYLSQLYAPSIILTALNTILFAIVRSKGFVRVQYVLNFVDFFLSIALTLPLIITYGTIGLIVGLITIKVITLTIVALVLFNGMRFNFKTKQ